MAKRAKGLLVWLLGALMLAAVVGCALTYSLQNEFIYPNAAEGPLDRPPPQGAIQHWLETADGSRVEGWLFVPQGASATGPAPAVIFFHGNSDYIENKIEYGDFYRSHGIACLMVEYRGYRRSTGQPSEAALAADADAFFDWLAARSEIDSSRIVAHGHSLGAAVAAGLASRRPVRGLIMVSPFQSLPALFGRFMVLGVLARERFDSMASLAAYTGPVLVMHGADDDIVPLEHAKALADVAGKRARLIVLDGVDHDIPWDWKTFGAHLLAFLTEIGAYRATG